MKRFYCLTVLMLSLVCTVCCGQNLVNLHKDNLLKSTSITGNQSKLINTQNINQGHNVHCGLQDKAGNLWFGTTGEGVYLYDGKLFTNYTFSDGLGSNEIWCIYEDREFNIWLGTGAGLCLYNPSALLDTSLKLFSILPITGPVVSNSQENSTTTDNPVWSILEDSNSNLWVGTSNGVYRCDKKGKPALQNDFIPFLSDSGIINKAKLYLKHIQCMVEDKNGHIWFASWNQEGACMFDGKNLTSFKPNLDGMVHSVMEDKNGNIWIGTRNHGACYYDGKTWTFFSEMEKFSSACIYSIAEDNNGTVWFGSEPYGVWSYHPEHPLKAGSTAFTNFTTKDGLINNSVFSVTPDRSMNLWIGSRGLGLCNYDGRKVNYFSE